MKTKLKLAAWALLSSLILHPSSLLAQGNLMPPGPPAPMMKTLAQVEPRMSIAAAPFTISAPGSYYLTANLTTAVSNAITIAVSGVTLDLNGFTIASTVANAANGGTAILLNGGLSDITICNGHIRGGVTNNDGVYSGSGFGHGIHYSGNLPMNVLVSRVSVSGCLYHGIYFYIGDSTVVESCTVRTVGNYGIVASTIKQSNAKDCGGAAIYGNQVSDCRGEASSDGYGVYATTALNCRGSSGSGTGVYAFNALNCYGSSISGHGVYAYRTAVGCYGYSSTGTAGLYAQNAATCTGDNSGGRAIQAIIANGCYAAAGTNLITHKYNMP